MDANMFMNMVGSMGFPIVMCIYLVHFMETEQKEMRNTLGDLRASIDHLTSHMCAERTKNDEK